jgi:hypothetical protein
MNKMRNKKGKDEEKLINGAKEIDSLSGTSKSQKLRKRRLTFRRRNFLLNFSTPCI